MRQGSPIEQVKGGKNIAKKVQETISAVEEQKSLKIVKHLPKDEERLGELSQRATETSMRSIVDQKLESIREQHRASASRRPAFQLTGVRRSFEEGALEPRTTCLFLHVSSAAPVCHGCNVSVYSNDLFIRRPCF